ncbi:MAG TPA: Na-translocating system protein MpsC family protein [Capillimicrobium sp.]|nr:Na-translocating system protein MpsC family protein [Capillimicrobium sp.]
MAPGTERGHDPLGAMRAAVSTGIVRAMAHLYGRGPTKAKTYFNDRYVFCVLEGGLTPNEERMVAAGEGHMVRDYRLRFQEVVAEELTGVVAAATGRTVVAYHSQVVFEPPRLFEIFLLDEPPSP